MRAAILLLAALLTATPAEAADGGARRFAVVAGASDGGQGRATLRYSTSDARQVARVLRRLGGVALDDLLFVAEPDAAGLRAALERVAAEAGNARKAGQRVELFLYFSGHADETGLLLGASRFPYAELRAELELVPADVRVAILDSCSSGAITRAKGGVKRPPFLLDASSSVKGHAFLTSSAADEASQESDRLKGSFFTHALLTGLRGGADASSDGVVTLQEAYHFAFRETLARTETTQGGPQHATYDIGLVGSGDVVMTDLRRADAALVIPPALEGTVFVRNAAGQLVAELRKVRGAGIELALEEGRYDVRVALERNVSSTTVELLSSARVVLDVASLAPASLEATTVRGGEDPSPRASTAPPSAPAPAAPGPVAIRTGPAWLTLTASSVFPQVDYRGGVGWGLQASAGTWIVDVIGLEGSIGFSRIKGRPDEGRLPASSSNGAFFYYDAFGGFVVDDTLSSIPAAVTLKLGLPSRTVRPYILGGVALELVRFERELDGPGTYTSGSTTITATSNRVIAYDLALGVHAGLGVAFQLGARMLAVAELRYQLSQPDARAAGQTLDSPNLESARFTAGMGYAF